MEVTDIFHDTAPPPRRNDALDDLVAESWGCTWPKSLQARLMDWRYYDDPVGRTTLLAMTQGRAVAMLDSGIRPYMLDGKRIMVRETGDWYCQESYRKFGVGLHLMRKLMRDYPEPMLVVGGSHANRAILARLWRQLPSAYSYILPLKARGLFGNCLRLTVPEYESLARIVGHLPFKPLRQVAPPAEDFQAEPLIDWPDDMPCDSAQELVGITTAVHAQRLATMPEAFGQAFGIIFRRNGAIVGCALAQTEETPSGKDGKILRIQTISDPDARLLRWIVAETSLQLARRGAEFIRCRASTSGKIAALRAVGYRLSQEIPCFWYHGASAAPPPTRIDVDYLRGDDAQPMQALIGLHMSKRIRLRTIGGRIGTLWRGLASAT